VEHVIQINRRNASPGILARNFPEIEVQFVFLFGCPGYQKKAEVLQVTRYCGAEYGPDSVLENAFFHEIADIRVIRISGVDYAGEGAGGPDQFPGYRIGSDPNDRDSICSSCLGFRCRVLVIQSEPLDRVRRIPELCCEIRIRHIECLHLQTLFADHTSMIETIACSNNAYDILYACIMHLHFCFIRRYDALE
jgi:hypothetical protein